MDLKVINDYLTKLAETSGKISKQTILEEIKENNISDVIEVLRFLNDPGIVTGLATKKVNKKIEETAAEEVNDLSDVLIYLQKNNTGSDADVLVVQGFISKNEEHREMLVKIFTKTYKTGLSAKTLNTVFGKDFIYKMELQLANTYSEGMKQFPDGTLYFVTIKFDGHRHVYHPTKRVFQTRSGKVNNGLNAVGEQVEKLQAYLADKYGKDFIFDGELIVEHSTRPKTEWFNETSSILSSKSDNKENIKFIVFDCVPVDEFEEDKKSTAVYSERRTWLTEAFENVDVEHVELAELLYEGTDQSKLFDLYETAVAQDEEGIMINLDEPYYCKRTKTLLKVKPVQSADLEIVGVEPGKVGTKLEHTLGALVVDYKGNRVSVGSGLNDEMRDEIWNNQDDYVGKIAEIIYTAESTNKNDDSISLRFPRFKTIRDDKTIDDINIE